jgi:tripartite motif-containing protein 2/3
MLNMLDMLSIEERVYLCTSCKDKEKAVARCADCPNFLCPKCVNAHQNMRCFEEHRVCLSLVRKNRLLNLTFYFYCF